MARRHHKLGSSRTNAGLVNDVNMRAISILEQDFHVHDASSYSILGDAPKVLLIHRASRGLEHAFIAKAPRREGPRECVTEHLISCIGQKLPLRLAKWKLARLRPRPGLVPGSEDPRSRNFCPEDVRFMSRFFLHPGETLVHGVELVAQCFDVDEGEIKKELTNRRDERQFYTVSLIDQVLQESAARDPGSYQKLRDGFARMMAFDALIGANDRHPQNWGVIVSTRHRTVPPRFSPLFDTARGLFWNHTDARLREREERGDQQRFIEKYARKSTPLVGLEHEANPNHFELIDYLVNRHPSGGFGAAIRSLFRAFEPQHLDRVLQRSAGQYFSRLRLKFIAQLLRFRYAETGKNL